MGNFENKQPFSFQLLPQNLWQFKLNWGDNLSNDLVHHCEHLSSQLSLLNTNVITRHVILEIPKKIDLHVFSDVFLKA